MMIKVGKMGLIDELVLQKHINQMDASLNKVKRKAARREERRQGLRQHVSTMKQAMQEMHDIKFKSGCAAAKRGASVDARVSILEKRLDMTLEMVQQMIEHQQESERE